MESFPNDITRQFDNFRILIEIVAMLFALAGLFTKTVSGVIVSMSIGMGILFVYAFFIDGLNISDDVVRQLVIEWLLMVVGAIAFFLSPSGSLMRVAGGLTYLFIFLHRFNDALLITIAYVTYFVRSIIT